MLLNQILKILHKPFSNLYDSSIILKNIDKVILLSIFSTFIFSTFLSSDVIGYLCFITLFLSIIRIITNPYDKLKCEKFEIFLLIYFMLSIVSVAGSTLLALSLKGFFKTFIYLGFYFSIVHHLKYNKKNIIPILWCIAGCVSFESLVGISQNFVMVEEISGWQDVSRLNPEEVMTRVYGTLQPLNPNLLGGYLITGIMSLIGLSAYYLNKKQIKRGICFSLLSILTILTIFYTGCRGAYISLFFILFSIFLISLKFFKSEYKRIYFMIVGLITCLGVSIILMISSLKARIISIFAMRADSSNSFRFNVYHASIQMFKDNWILGIGMGNQNFREIYGLYMKTGFDALSAYNIYLETAVESGIFALMSFIVFLAILSFDGVRFIKNSLDRNKIILVVIPLITIFAVMVHGMVDTVFFRPQIQVLFWTMVAILSNQLYSEV